jgi:hypothetical protein
MNDRVPDSFALERSNTVSIKGNRMCFEQRGLMKVIHFFKNIIARARIYESQYRQLQ